MFRQVLLFGGIYLLAFTPYFTSAMTDEQKDKIHKEFHALGLECIKVHVISKEDIDNLKSRNLPTGENVPCFLACMMKKAGIMDENGMLQHENALEQAKKIFDDEEELKNIESYLHSCSHINAEAVTDAEKGCNRAQLAYKCMMENLSQFGLDV